MDESTSEDEMHSAEASCASSSERPKRLKTDNAPPEPPLPSLEDASSSQLQPETSPPPPPPLLDSDDDDDDDAEEEEDNDAGNALGLSSFFNDSTSSSQSDSSTDGETAGFPSFRRCLRLGAISDSFDFDSSASTVLHDTDSDSNDDHHPLAKKPRPAHDWMVVREMARRQTGATPRLQAAQQFQRACYGSLYAVQRLDFLHKLERHEGCVNSLNFHASGTYLASGSDDLKVVVWDWARARPLLAFDTKHRGNVFQSRFMPLSGDLHVATSATDGMVRLHHVAAQEGLRSSRKLGRHRGPCHKLSVMPDQPHMLLSAGEDGVIYRFDVRDQKPDRLLTVKRDSREVALYSISSHPLNTHEFCVSGRDNFVRSYDQRKIDLLHKPMKVYHPKEKYRTLHVTCAVYNHNGTEILASYNDGDIYLFDVQGALGTFVHHYEGHRNCATIKGVNFFGPKSEFVVSGSDCGNLYFWDKNTEAVVNWMSADENGVVNCLEPHPQLPYLCTSGLDWDVKVWVPSCDHEPNMTDLLKTVRANRKARQSNFGNTESQMLWMLWRHLRNNSTRAQRFRNNEVPCFGSEPATATTTTTSSGESSNSSHTVVMGERLRDENMVEEEAEDDEVAGLEEEEEDDVLGCTTS